MEHYVDLLGARDLVEGWTTAADVERTKPQPDLVHAALGKVGEGPAVIGELRKDRGALARLAVTVSS